MALEIYIQKVETAEERYENKVKYEAVLRWIGSIIGLVNEVKKKSRYFPKEDQEKVYEYIKKITKGMVALRNAIIDGYIKEDGFVKSVHEGLTVLSLINKVQYNNLTGEYCHGDECYHSLDDLLKVKLGGRYEGWETTTSLQENQRSKRLEKLLYV